MTTRYYFIDPSHSLVVLVVFICRIAKTRLQLRTSPVYYAKTYAAVESRMLCTYMVRDGRPLEFSQLVLSQLYHRIEYKN